MKKVLASFAGMALAGSAVSAPQAAGAEPATHAPAAECVRATGSVTASCERIVCEAKYRDFLGTWRGEFHAYLRTPTKSGATFRPYRESVAYAESDCLRDKTSGDTFIVGHVQDVYPDFEGLPAKTESGLLITGRRADGTLFLRTAGAEGSHDYEPVYQNGPARLSIWRLRLPAAHEQPLMTFTLIDGEDFSAPSAPTRNVTVTMQVGPDNSPYWSGVIAYGSHTRTGG